MNLKKGFAEAQAQAIEEENEMKPPTQTICYHFRSFLCRSPLSPFFDDFYSQKKRDGN
jgi:hypothetical protein